MPITDACKCVVWQDTHCVRESYAQLQCNKSSPMRGIQAVPLDTHQSMRMSVGSWFLADARSYTGILCNVSLRS